MKLFRNFSPTETKVLDKLSTPSKIQDYLDKLPMNFSEKDPCFCPREVIQKQTAHCMEGALFAAAALLYHGKKPLLMDLTTTSNDEDHVVALYKVNGYWGAISKTNHAVLRYREPVYKTVRELALSYFHEYFLDTGKKTLRTFSRPFDLSKQLHLSWLDSRQGIMELIQNMADSLHYDIAPKRQLSLMRKADEVEIAAGKIVEWKKTKIPR